MKRLRARLLLLAGAAGLAFALPAAGQRDGTAESVLPPGFGDPTAPPAPPPKQTPPPGEEPPSETGEPPAEDEPPPPPPSRFADAPIIENSAAEDLEDAPELNLPPPIELPDEARRPTDVVGVLTPENGGLGFEAWGNAHGRLLASLMGRLDAPLPSRWASILLRRALLSEVPAPRLINDVDWVAERAWLLLRMGEADAARMLVQSVDVDRFTPRMFTVAFQTGLATADPAALCPLIGPGRALSEQPWGLAEAMCAALQGDASRASQLIDQSRRRLGAGSIDVLLAEKVVGAGTNTRRAVTIQWDGVEDLSAWRFGLASATGLKVPEALMNRASSHVRAWEARAPMIPLEERLRAAQDAATLGVFSHSSLVDIYSLIADGTDASDLEDSIAGRLQRAYLARTVGARLSAMQGLWDEGSLGGDRYGRLLLTSTAAARIAPAEEHGERAADLVASMIAAGLDRRAARWGEVVDGRGGDGDRAWSILAVGAPRPVVDLGSGRVGSFADDAGGHRGRMLVAALAGLGRFDDPAGQGVDPAPRSRWAQMIAAAARQRQPGTVALLAAVGMQTGGWRGVPPEHLYHIVRALKEVGLEYEARMIAAEAMTRL
jgi:hypothetical protein